MKNIKPFFLSNYQFHKMDYWIICLLNIFTALLFAFFQVNELIQGLVIFVLFLKTASFVRSANLLPSISSDFDRFSWKYYQGLPLSKKEIILSLMLIDLFVMSSLLVWGLSFFGQLGELFLDKKTYDFELAGMILLFFAPICWSISSLSLINQIKYPRKQYSKNDPKLVFLNQVKYFVIICFAATYSSILFVGLISAGYKIPAFVVTFFVFSSSLMKSWWGILPAVAVAFILFNRIFQVWQNEKNGYVKYAWNPKKDTSILAFCSFMIILPFGFDDHDVPRDFRGPLNEAVYHNDMKSVEHYLASGHDLNKPNEYGISPLMVAARAGHLEMFKFLESKGANINFKVSHSKAMYNFDVVITATLSDNLELFKYVLSKVDSQKSRSTDGDTPLHLAVGRCKMKFVDELLAKNADTNAVNKSGNTPLHVAAKARCFGAVAGLIEAGADPLKQNLKGKLALDMVKDKAYAQDLAYYLEKKTRAPAGKE